MQNRPRTRALSEAAARNCENASKPRCRCRCGGKNHGSARIDADALRSEYTELGESDPHYLPPEPERKPRRRPGSSSSATRPTTLPLPFDDSR